MIDSSIPKHKLNWTQVQDNTTNLVSSHKAARLTPNITVSNHPRLAMVRERSMSVGSRHQDLAHTEPQVTSVMLMSWLIPRSKGMLWPFKHTVSHWRKTNLICETAQSHQIEVLWRTSQWSRTTRRSPNSEQPETGSWTKPSSATELTVRGRFLLLPIK